MRDGRSQSPPNRSESSLAPGRKKREHRACYYCRTHRIKCIPVEGDDRCRRCVDHDMLCDKLSAPPKDARPRRRLLFKTSANSVQFQGVEAGYLGSSSLVLLAWKYAPQRPDVIDKLRGIDDRFDLYRGSIGGLEQDGLLSAWPKPAWCRSWGRRRSSMITCRDSIIPYFPVISVSESLLADKASDEHVTKYAAIDPHSTPPTPLPHIVRMIHCAIASRSRAVPERVRQSVLASLHNLVSGAEMAKVVASRSLGNIQVLILLSMCDDLNAPDPIGAEETVWQNVGRAIRMALAIGLHRNVAPSHIPYFQLNRRLRVWGACVCADRWQALKLGRGFAIDLADGDAPLPRKYADGIREGEGETTVRSEPVFPCFGFLAEFTRLSILLGRVYRLVGTPQGLQAAEDYSLVLLQVDIDAWIAQLPTAWPYSIRLALGQGRALMDLFIVGLEFTLQRCFLWPTGSMPSHITYRPGRERWLELCQRTERAIHWMNTSEGAFYLDVWSFTIYPAFCCVIIEAKAFEESGSANHRELLRLADAVIGHWAAQAPQNPLRARLAALSSLLCSVATTALPPDTGIVSTGLTPAATDLLAGPLGGQNASGSSADEINQRVSDLFANATTNSEAGFDSSAFDQMCADAIGLDPIWFEHV
ncbi:hypothetical protein Q5752_001115 [Cryptotrichosporon argae]